jgi:hypothetical protein
MSGFVDDDDIRSGSARSLNKKKKKKKKKRCVRSRKRSILFVVERERFSYMVFIILFLRAND